MRNIIAVILFALSSISFANMASPYREGTKVASAFTSSDIDILQEKINVILNKEYSSAGYIIEYKIRTDKEGNQIPLLFYAADYKDDFKVWVDGREVTVQKIPDSYTAGTFDGFSKSFYSNNNNNPEVAIRWKENSSTIYKLNDLKYFEVDLSKGEHTIRVEYTAAIWENRSNWIKEYGYRYSLSPAKHWKSFGTLEISVNANGFGEDIKTNLGQPAGGRLDSVAVWKFDKLPADVFDITYTPKISSFANILLALEPSGLATIVGLGLLIIHLFLMWRYRRNNPEKRFSWVMIVGSLIIPAIILFYYVYSFEIIDNAIGVHASRYHGYNFLVFLIYPVLMPVYLIIMWLLDVVMKKRVNSNI
ncbi:MAG: hypothetical protein WC139_01025 [Candidatus Kapaibacterium sp.]